MSKYIVWILVAVIMHIFVGEMILVKYSNLNNTIAKNLDIYAVNNNCNNNNNNSSTRQPHIMNNMFSLPVDKQNINISTLPPLKFVVTMTMVKDDINQAFKTVLNFICKHSIFELIPHNFGVIFHIPYIAFKDASNVFPQTKQIRSQLKQACESVNPALFTDEWINNHIIIHRCKDYGPITRYIGITDFVFQRYLFGSIDETRFISRMTNQTVFVTFDGDSNNDARLQIKTAFELLYNASSMSDKDAVWAYAGENVGKITKRVLTKHNSSVDTQDEPQTQYRFELDWNKYNVINDDINQIVWNYVEIIRGASGVAFKFQHLYNSYYNIYSWMNQTEYYIGCVWDDDYYFSFYHRYHQVKLKILQPLLTTQYRHNRITQSRKLVGTLTATNQKLDSTQKCVSSIVYHHGKNIFAY